MTIPSISLTILIFLFLSFLLHAEETSNSPPLSAEAAKERELEVLREVADLTLLPPRLNTDPLPEYAVENLDYGMTIGIERSPKGPMLSISRDVGKTWWDPVFPPQIKHPEARLHLRKLASGSWLSIKHGETIDQHRGRSHLSAWLSDDEGETWEGGLILDERGGVSYPDGFQAPDGSIYVSYDWNRSEKGHILFAKFTESDIRAGKLVSDDSRLRQPIMIPGKLNPKKTGE